MSAMHDWREWIGRTSTATAQLDVEHANHLAVTLDRAPSFQLGDALPPAWHWLYFHDLVKAADLGADGHPRLGLVMPPVPLPRRMWAGGSLEFHTPLRLGETIERTSVICAITPKEGRSGPLYFVDIEYTLRTQEVVNLLEQQTIVYRALAREVAPKPVPAAPTDADYARPYSLDPTALFRYSALTFNGHRIHYDVDYCRAVEGYPNLVVHGPLLATLLLDLYCQQGRPITRFTYRAVSPVCLPHPFMVSGKAEGRGAKLWASTHAGSLAMEAEAVP